MKRYNIYADPLDVFENATGEWVRFEEANKRIRELEQAIAALRRGEFICSKCGLRKDAEFKKGDF